MTTNPAQLDAMIEEGEEMLAEFEAKLASNALDCDTPRAMHILSLMCRNLNQLYAERHALLEAPTVH